jgi:hypothetical protein
MKIYVLPVSGGGFAVQIGLLKAIYDATMGKKCIGITPDLVLGSSGGNVAAYLAMIGNWCSNSIMKNSHLINSSLFVESWTPPFFPSWIAFPLTKSIYRNGQGVKELFNKVYTPSSIDTTEIWSGTYNTVSQKSAFFCNKSIEKSLIKDTGEPTYIYDMEPSVYLNGDRDKIAKVCHASASIPIMTEGVIINDQLHIDGGAGFASPFTPLSPKITEIIHRKTYDEPIQLYHFSSYDMNQRFSDSFYSNSIGLLIHSSLVQDRAATIDYLSKFGKVNPMPTIHEDVNHNILRVIINELGSKSYVMALSPKRSLSVTLTSFTGKDVVKIVNQIELDFTVMVWTMLYRY